MSKKNEYQVQAPRVSNKGDIDNPLLPKGGVPINESDFVDSTARIVGATGSADLRAYANKNIWNVDPGQFYDNSGLSGIDATPGSTKQFDLGKFNIMFDRNKEIEVENQRIRDLNKLNAMAQETHQVKLYDLSLLDIIINTKNAWFNLLDDLLDQRFEIETFTQNNRLFYIGITIIFFTVIIYLYILLTQSDVLAGDNRDTNKNNNESVHKIYHIHQYPITPQQKTS